MKLFTAKISPYAAMCRAQIYIKGLDIQFMELPDDASWEDIKAVSPIKKIPVLVDGDQVVPESQVICEYLEDRFPEQSLRPSDAASLARMRLLVRIADAYIMTRLTPLFTHLSRKHRDQDVVDRQIKLIEKGLISLECFLAESGFAVGQQVTLADCTLVPILVFVEKYMPFFDIESPFSKYPKLLRYWDKIQLNPNMKRVIDEIQQGINAKK